MDSATVCDVCGIDDGVHCPASVDWPVLPDSSQWLPSAHSWSGQWRRLSYMYLSRLGYSLL